MAFSKKKFETEIELLQDEKDNIILFGVFGMLYNWYRRRKLEYTA